MKSKDLQFALLLDTYGGMLTENQREVMELYYCEDLSLGEIAQNTDITRQAVRDTIKRAEGMLLEMEDKIGAAAGALQQRRLAREIMERLEEIDRLNTRQLYSPQLRALTQSIETSVRGLLPDE